MVYRPNIVTNPYFGHQYYIDRAYNYLKVIIEAGVDANSFDYKDIVRSGGYDIETVKGFLRQGKNIDVVEVVYKADRQPMKYRFTPCALYKFQKHAVTNSDYFMIRSVGDVIAGRHLNIPVDLSL
jgi:hypothetical protein